MNPYFHLCCFGKCCLQIYCCRKCCRTENFLKYHFLKYCCRIRFLRKGGVTALQEFCFLKSDSHRRHCRGRCCQTPGFRLQTLHCYFLIPDFDRRIPRCHFRIPGLCLRLLRCHFRIRDFHLCLLRHHFRTPGLCLRLPPRRGPSSVLCPAFRLPRLRSPSRFSPSPPGPVLQTHATQNPAPTRRNHQPPVLHPLFHFLFYPRFPRSAARRCPPA